MQKEELEIKEKDINKQKIKKAIKDKEVKDKEVKAKEVKNKSKQLNIVNVDLENNKQIALPKTDLQNNNSSINNIDLFYLTNQQQYSKTCKIESLLNNNCLLKEIYENLDENIKIYKEDIVKYNKTTLEKLLENNNKINSFISNNNISEKYKLYYLLYILNLVLY